MSDKHYYHIVAASGDLMTGQGVIGLKNQLPWPKNIDDMKFFVATTANHTVIMGRKTFESIGGKPLSKRENIVVTSDPNFQAPANVKAVHSLPDAFAASTHENVFIIGGSQIYQQTIDKVDEIYWTRIPGDYPGDIKYPRVPPKFQEDSKKSVELTKKFNIEIHVLKNTEITNT